MGAVSTVLTPKLKLEELTAEQVAVLFSHSTIGYKQYANEIVNKCLNGRKLARCDTKEALDQQNIFKDQFNKDDILQLINGWITKGVDPSLLKEKK